MIKNSWTFIRGGFSRLLALLTVIGILVVCTSQGAYGQSVLNVRHYSIQRDLGQSNFSNMLQDSLGYIWIAAFNGLVRYDGYEFRTFKSQQGDSIRLSSNRLNNIFVNHDGNIVCNTYDNRTYLFDTQRLLFSAELDSITEQDLYECPATHGLKTSDSGIISAPSRLPEEVQQAIKDRQETGGQYRFTAFKDHSGDFWVQLQDGILYYYNATRHDLEQATYYEDGHKTVLHSEAQNAMQDRQGNLWYKDADEGLHYLCLTPRRHEEIEHPMEMLPRALMCDRQGNLWIGWKHNSKNKFGSLSVYDRRHQLMGYLTTDGRLVSDPKSAQFDQSGVYCLYEDHEGNFWIGGRNNGLYVMRPTEDPERFTAYHYEKKEGVPDALQSSSIYDIKEDSSGRLWIATWSGSLAYVSNGREISDLHFHTIQAKQIQGLKPGQEGLCRKVRHLQNDHSGRLLISTEAGLLVCPKTDVTDDQLSFILLSSDGRNHSLQGNSVQQVTELKDHRLLISELGGLDVVSDDKLLSDHPFRAAVSNEIASRNIYATMQSRRGDVWVVTESTVLLMNDSLSVARELFPFAQRCSETCPMQDSSGRLYFGIDNAVYCLNDSLLNRSIWTPHILITNCNRSTEGHGVYDISWAAIDYRNPDAIRYAYRLKKKDSQGETPWTDLEHEHTLENLTTEKGGDYVLEIHSTDAEGIWCDNVIAIDLHFSRTWAEYLNWMLILLLLAATGIIVWQMKRYWDYRKRHKEAVEALLSQAEQTQLHAEGISTKESAQTPKKSQEAGLKEEDRQFLRDMDDYVEKHLLSGELNIQQIAEEFSMSRTAYYRYLKAITGVAPVEYVRIYKVKKACLMLANPRKSIQEVAYECGFGTPQSFTKAFKEVKNCTPKDFRSKIVRIDQNG